MRRVLIALAMALTMLTEAGVPTAGALTISGPRPPRTIVRFSTVPLSGTAWTTCSGGVADGVPIAGYIRPTTTTVVSVKQTARTYARLTLWQRVRGFPCHFTPVYRETARIGANGMVAGYLRQQDTYTTPTGTYTMTQSFGNGSAPVTALPYRVTGWYDYWVEDNDSAWYNTYRSSLLGGFSTADSERLRDYGTQYRYAVVIDFNMPPNAVRHRGAGIFLHVNGAGATAGCVSISAAGMLRVMGTIKPGDLIAIGT